MGLVQYSKMIIFLFPELLTRPDVLNLYGICISHNQVFRDLFDLSFIDSFRLFCLVIQISDEEFRQFREGLMSHVIAR